MQPADILSVSSREEWRQWLADHHGERKEIWLRLFKKHSGHVGVDYEASVEEALCYGWIDGLVRTVDDMSYAIRFTPRRPRSNWSDSNRARIKRLLERGAMQPAGLAVLPDDLRPSKSQEQ